MANNLNIMFLDVQYIKDRSTLMNNIEDKFVATHILESQDIHLQQILGSNLYEDMIYDFDSILLTFGQTKYRTLNEDYIQPCLMYYTLYESVDDLYAKFTNKSVVTQTSDNSQVVSEAFLSKRKDDFLNKAEYYAQRLTKYLQDNYTTYDKYYKRDGEASDIVPGKTQYSNNGWFLGGTTPSFSDQSIGGGGDLPDMSLNDLTDVNISSPTSPQVLTYNGSKWVNADISATFTGATQIWVENYVTDNFLSGDTTASDLNAYTKPECDANFLSGNTFIPTDFYSKSQANANFLSANTSLFDGSYTSLTDVPDFDSNYLSANTSLFDGSYNSLTDVPSFNSMYLSANTSFYTQSQTNANFLSANTYLGYTDAQINANFLSANTSYYTQSQANANFLSANTAFSASLSGLSDTQISNPQANQFLIWNGTKWANTTYNDPSGVTEVWVVQNFLSANTSFYTQSQANANFLSASTEYVPYTGATKDVDLGHHILSLDAVQFDIVNSGISTEGRLLWNINDKTLNLGLDGNSTLQIGQEQLIRVVNKSGQNILNGQVVFIDGVFGNRPTIGLADYRSETGSTSVIGLVTTSPYIEDDHNGYITTTGLVRDLDLSIYTEGDILYLYTGGTFTNIEPIAPNHRVRLGVVTNNSSTEGTILVEISLGEELSELHDVLISGVTNNQVLKYDSTSGLWKNSSDFYLKSETDSNFLSANTILYTKVEAESSFLSANTSLFDGSYNSLSDVPDFDSNYLSANTILYTKVEAESSFLSANTSFYTQPQTNANFLSASTNLNQYSITSHTHFQTSSTTADFIFFNTGVTAGDFAKGKLYYDSTWETLSVEAGRDSTLQIGQEEWRRVYNNTGTLIENGKAVYTNGTYTGGTNNVATIALAKADSTNTYQVLGVTTQDIPTGSYGMVTVRGHVNGLDTSSFPNGSILYLSDLSAGTLTTSLPSAGNYKARVGRCITSAVDGRINVRLLIPGKLDDLSNVALTTPAVDDILKWNGTEWISGPATISNPSIGIAFYMDDTTIIPTSSANTYEVVTLSKTPVTTTEVVDALSVTVANSPLFGEAYLYNTALGRTQLDGGVWTFNTYASVSSTASRTSSLRRNIYQVISGTCSTSGSGTSRTLVATESIFAISNTGNTRLDCSYVNTNQGIYQILTFVSSTEVTILTPTGYTNETSAPFNKWNFLFTTSTGTITSLTTNYTLYTTTTTQPTYPVNLTDKLGEIIFGVSNNTTTVSFVHNGTSRYSHFITPLITMHNNLAGLNIGDYKHLTATEYTNTAAHIISTANPHSVTASQVGAYTTAQSNANFLSANTSFYTQSQVNTGFLTASTYIPTDSNFLSANTSFYTQSQANANFLSANTSFYTQSQVDSGFLTASTSIIRHLSGLTDVTITSPTDNDVLIYSTNKWVNTATTLVDVSNPTTGQVITYDGANWINSAASFSSTLYYTKIESDANFLSASTSLFTAADADSRYLSANTSFYTQSQVNSGFLSASTSYLSPAVANTSYLSANTSFYTQSQANANFLSANTAYLTSAVANSSYLSANTSFYTQSQANANFLSASTSYYTQSQANANFLSAATFEEKTFQIEFTTGASYYLTTYAPYGYNVVTLYLATDTGTATISLSGGSAGATAIGGLTSITGGTAITTYTATSANEISSGHRLKLVVNSITSSATTIYGTIKTQRI